MKIFLDDIRNAPDNSWVVVRDGHICMNLLSTGIVTEISFDHDLGDDWCNGYDVLCHIELLVWHGAILKPIIYIHTDNAGARNKMVLAKKKIEEM